MQYYDVRHHFKAKCTKFHFRLGCTLDLAACRSLQCSPVPLAEFKGPVSKGKKGKGDKMVSEEGKNRGGARKKCEA